MYVWCMLYARYVCIYLMYVRYACMLRYACVLRYVCSFMFVYMLFMSGKICAYACYVFMYVSYVMHVFVLCMYCMRVVYFWFVVCM